MPILISRSRVCPFWMRPNGGNCWSNGITRNGNIPSYACINCSKNRRTYPDAIALVCHDEQVSYRQLNQRSNQIAHHLMSLGVGPEMRVGICVHRSVEMPATLLGILKAGGAYVPLDPDYPMERLRFIESDASLSAIVTNTAAKQSLSEMSSPLVCLETLNEFLGRDHNPICQTRSGNLAYVMYTSGTTGTPKGVEVLHRGIVRLIRGVEYVRIDSKEVFLQLAPISFDASTFEIWGPLLTGARCVLFPCGIAMQQSLAVP